MKEFLFAALATAVFASNAIAKDAADSLAPGKPAGVQQAQSQEISPVVYLGLGAVAVVALIAADHSSHHNGGTSSSTTTTGTSP